MIFACTTNASGVTMCAIIKNPTVFEVKREDLVGEGVAPVGGAKQAVITAAAAAPERGTDRPDDVSGHVEGLDPAGSVVALG